jgi:hypothetical protein
VQALSKLHSCNTSTKLPRYVPPGVTLAATGCLHASRPEAMQNCLVSLLAKILQPSCLTSSDRQTGKLYLLRDDSCELACAGKHARSHRTKGLTQLILPCRLARLLRQLGDRDALLIC